MHLSQLVNVQRGGEDWFQLGTVREARPTVEYAREDVRQATSRSAQVGSRLVAHLTPSRLAMRMVHLAFSAESQPTRPHLSPCIIMQQMKLFDLGVRGGLEALLDESGVRPEVAASLTLR